MAPRFEPATPGAGPLVRGFSPAGSFVVGDEAYPAILLTPERVIPWEAPALIELAAADVTEAIEVQPPPEFLLLGTGRRLIRPPAAFVGTLEALGIGIEAMDSRAAARTWAVLRAEERQVVAALMPL